MSSWSATCLVTQLPIEDAQSVVMIPVIFKSREGAVRSSSSGAGNVRNDSFAQPLSLPLRGTYNGSGGLKDNNLASGQAYFKDLLKSYFDKGALCHGPDAIAFTSFPDDYMAHFFHGGLKLLIENPDKNILGMVAHPLGACFVQESLYDTLTQAVGRTAAGTCADSGFPISKYTLEMQHYASVPDMNTRIESYIQMMENKTKHVQNFDVRSKLDTIRMTVLNSYFPDVLTKMKEVYFTPEGIKKALIDATFENKVDIRQDIIDFNMFCGAMLMLRKQWIPQAGLGSTLGLESELTHQLFSACTDFANARLRATLPNPKSDFLLEQICK